MTFEQLQLLVLTWAKERSIIPNSNPMAQGLKTAEECVELLQALNKKDSKEVIDAYGDILVTLIIGAELYGVNLVACLEAGYDEIKNRTGTLGPDGIFYRDKDGSIK